MRLRELFVRFVRRLPIAVGASVTFAVAAFIVGGNVFLDSQTLTEQQVRRLELGNAAAVVKLPAGEPVPGGSDVPDELRRAVGGAADIEVQFFDFPLPRIANDQILYRELSWKDGSGFPYQIDEGTWPDSPGEVVVIGGSSEVGAGEQLTVLGEEREFDVVGNGHSTLTRRVEILAAPGTWSLLPNDQGELSQLEGELLAYFPNGNVEAGTDVLATAMAGMGVSAWRSPNLSAQLGQATRDRDEVAGTASRPWTQSSPASFWVPGLLLMPLGVVTAFVTTGKRTRVALSRLVKQGVKPRTSALGVWSAVASNLLVATVAGGALGFLLGWAAAQWGRSTWGSPAPAIRVPYPAMFCLILGLTIGLAIGYRMLAEQASTVGSAVHQGRLRRITLGNTARRIVILLLTSVALQTWFSMSDFDQVLRFSAIGVALAVLFAPDAAGALFRERPDAALSIRLRNRLASGNASRVLVVVVVVAGAFGCVTSFLIAYETVNEAERQESVENSQSDQVILDNDGSPSLPVPAEVRAAAESVPSLARQMPVQLATLQPGDATSADAQMVIDTGTYTFLALAFESAQDISRTFGRDLSAEETRQLGKGGALVIDKRVPLGPDVELVDPETPSATVRLQAQRSDLVNDPISEAVGAVILKATADDLGLQTRSGGLVYTGITEADAQKVRDALVDVGIHPENAWIYQTPKKFVPEFALYGSALSLIILATLLAGLTSRAQVRASRSWLSRLTVLGVPSRWGLSVVFQLYLAASLIGIVLGGVAGWGTMTLSGIRLGSGVETVVPWAPVAGSALLILLGVGCATWLSVRRLSYREGATEA